MTDLICKDGKAALLKSVPKYIKAIMTPEDTSFDRLSCPSPTSSERYNYLRATDDAKGSEVLPKYFFALDLHQCVGLLPRLMGSIVEAVRFLGPSNCAISIVEGRSDDGTYEVLKFLTEEMRRIGLEYHFKSSDVNPSDGNRIEGLARLRNIALEPLTNHTDQYAPDTTVIFLNDVAICMEDILELIHQRIYQGADMTCAMDWTYVGHDPTFYDVWVARGMNGDSFFNIPEDGNWNSAWNVFWNNPTALERYHSHKSFQVFSCWNGATAFTAQPLIEKKVKFRRPSKKECGGQGEPQLFCKDMWNNNFGKIAVVPSVNLEYSDDGARKIKGEKGYTSAWAEGDSDKIEWQDSPPEKVKCMEGYTNQKWVPWNEGL